MARIEIFNLKVQSSAFPWFQCDEIGSYITGTNIYTVFKMLKEVKGFKYLMQDVLLVYYLLLKVCVCVCVSAT